MLMRFLTAIFLLSILLPNTGLADERERNCSSYSAIDNSDQDSKTTFPQEMLIDQHTAVYCITRILTELSVGKKSPVLSQNTRLRLNRATGALLRIIGKKDKTDRIRLVRNYDSSAMIHLLALGARSTDKPTRLNSTHLLANIIDNTNVCVVMDHFGDPNFFTLEPGGTNGRANLAAAIAVVAPWAYKKNYKNIDALYEHLDQQVRNLQDVSQTRVILDNLRGRLDYQKNVLLKDANKNRVIPDDLNTCKKWKFHWANKEGALFKFEVPYN